MKVFLILVNGMRPEALENVPQAQVRSVDGLFDVLDRAGKCCAFFYNWEQQLAVLPEEYTIIVTADHGGRDRNHGTDLPEDRTIPLMIRGKDFAPGRQLGQVSILDIAPTVAALLGVKPCRDWEGKSLL